VSLSGSIVGLLVKASQLLIALVSLPLSVFSSCKQFIFLWPGAKPCSMFLVAFHFSMCVVITIASVCGKDMSLISASVKVSSMCDHLVHMIGPSTAT
jgi:hypothetical protein